MSVNPMTALDHYQEAERLFQNINYMWPPYDQLELYGHLEKAYEGIDKFSEKRSSLFYMAGRSLYNKRNVDESRKSANLFALSFYTHLVSLNIFSEDQVPDMGAGGLTEVSGIFNSNLASVYDTFENHSSIWSKLSEGNINPTELFSLAEKVFWFGRSLQAGVAQVYQNKERLFGSINNLVKDILAKVGTKDALWMRNAVVPFYMSPLLFELQNPEKGKWEVLETLGEVKKAFDLEGKTVRRYEMEAELYNQEATKYRYMLSHKFLEEKTSKKEIQDLLQKQYKELCQAVEIANSTQGFDPFLRNQLILNKARVAMECKQEGSPVLGDDEIGEQLNIVLEFMKATQYCHQYFLTFLCAIIRFEIDRGNVERAVEHLTQALHLCFEKFSKTPDKGRTDEVVKVKDLVLNAMKGGYESHNNLLCLSASIEFDVWRGEKKKANTTYTKLEMINSLSDDPEKMEGVLTGLKKKIEACPVRTLNGYKETVQRSPVDILCITIQADMKKNNVEGAIESLTRALELCSKENAEQCDEGQRKKLIELRDRIIGVEGIDRDKSKYFSYLCANVEFELWCGNKEKAKNELTAAQNFFKSSQDMDGAIAAANDSRLYGDEKEAVRQTKIAREAFTRRQETLVRLNKKVNPPPPRTLKSKK